MLFKEKPNSKIWVAQKGLFLPSSSIQELSTKQEESLSPLEIVIVYIGLIPATVREQYEKEVILTEEQKKVLSIFQKQYRDISRWLGVFAFPNDEVEAKLKEGRSNFVKPFADYFWKMLDVLKTCLEETEKDKNFDLDYLYVLWYKMLYNYFMESLKNGGFLMPLSNDQPKSKRELMKIWENDLTPRLDAINASVNDYSMFSEIGDNWELFEGRLHRIFFDNSFRWAKENNNYKLIEAVSDLWEQEKKLIDIINKRKGCGDYQVITIHNDGINTTGRDRPEGFGNPSTSKRKKSKRGKKNKIPETFGDLDFVRE